MKSSIRKTSHGGIIIMRGSPEVNSGQAPEAGSPKQVPRIEFGAGRGRLSRRSGQVPETSSGQVMAAEKKI